MRFYTSIERHRNDILVRGYEDGVRIQEKVRFKPTLFPTINTPESPWKTLYGQNVEPLQFDCMSEATEHCKLYSGVENYTVHGQTNYVHQYITEQWPNDIKFDREIVNVTTLDIEVESEHGFPEPSKAEYPLISITLKNNIDKRYYVFGIGAYENTREDVLYVDCKDEVTLLTKFLQFWSHKKFTPDVVTGWNVEKFDMTYLINRISKVLDNNMLRKLSPWNQIPQAQRDGEWYDINGIQVIDYMDAFKKFCLNTYGQQESYRLDAIATTVLGDNKLSYEEYGSLHMLYKENYQKFIDYNIKDVELVERLEEKLGLITLIMTMAYKAGVNYSTTFGTTVIWDSILYRVLNADKIAIPPMENKPKGDYPGGYVKDVQAKAHDWICSFDLNSLYPNILVEWNMSPETIVNNEKKDTSVDAILNGDKSTNNYALAASGNYFKKDHEGVIPRIIRKYYDERVIIKGRLLKAQKEYQNYPTKRLENEIENLNNQQMAIKILMNSLYGALGNKWFRYFDQRVAESVTLTGQLCIKWAEKALNSEINKTFKTDKDYVVAMDTDSLYVDMSEFVKKFQPKKPIDFLDKVCAKLEDVFEKSYEQLAQNLNVYENRMGMKREVIADRGIWLAKKRYILHVHDSEGVRFKEPQIKMMGIEAIKSSTPQICRKRFKEVFKLILTGTRDEVVTFIDIFRKEWNDLPAEDVAFPRGVSNISSWVGKTKSVPIHVRSALLFNSFLKKKGITNIEPIKNGTKIKFMYMRPSPMLGENVFGFTHGLPKEFGLDNYIDYQKQFDKSFMFPLTPILQAAGIHYTNSVSLDDFFT
tara:strand:- start:15182 stop:17626 length:2445 start_codon:yes stop_codon:yes gene_type:complete